MREVSFLQFAIVSGDNAELLTERLNLKLKELKDKNPTVSFEGLTARISYTETTGPLPETLGEEYQLAGITLTCGECPFFEEEKKNDGTPDGRKKVGGCPFAQYGKTFRDCRACERLFELIKEGGVKVCLVRSE